MAMLQLQILARISYTPYIRIYILYHILISVMGYNALVFLAQANTCLFSSMYIPLF